MTQPLLTTVGDALRRSLWRWRLRLGAAGLVALLVALAAGGGAALLAMRARADLAQEAQLRQALAQAGDSLARQRQAESQRAAQQQEQIKQAALAQAQAERPPAPRPGMQLDARAGDEFVDPEQSPQGAVQAAPPPPPVLPAGTAPARVLLARLPPLSQRDDDLAQVLALAREVGLANARAQYRRLEPRSAGIQRLEITLSANEDFEAWRRLMVGVLNRLPHAAVSGAAWSRPQAEGGATEARMGFVLYHRAGPAP